MVWLHYHGDNYSIHSPVDSNAEIQGRLGLYLRPSGFHPINRHSPRSGKQGGHGPQVSANLIFICQTNLHTSLSPSPFNRRQIHCCTVDCHSIAIMDTYIYISKPEIHAAIRFSLRSNSHVKDAGFSASGVEESPGFRKLIEGVLYSRRFILSYQLVLLALLLVFMVLHWGGRLRGWSGRGTRGRKGGEGFRGGMRTKSQEAVSTDRRETPDLPEEPGSGASSSSTTLRGTPRSPKALSVDNRENERTPLLGMSKAAIPRSWISTVIYQIRAFLVYQPRPIPYINKILPSNSSTLAVLALITLQVFYSLWNVPLSLPMLFIFADRTSLVFVANLPLLYLFAAKNQPLKVLTGYSYESLNIFHRRLGEVMCLLALFHSVGMIGVWYTILRPAGFTLARFLLGKIILLGIGAFLAYETLYFTSLGSFRQRWYEIFLGTHIILQVIALVLLWFHHQTSRPYVAAALAVFLIDRLVYRMFSKSEKVRVSLEVQEDQQTVVLQAIVPLSAKHRTFRSFARKGISSGWKATEHVFLTIPSLSHKDIIQAHPFTIASKAPSDGNKYGDLKLIVRAQGGFSSDLLKYSRRHDTAVVGVDGPYGSQTAVRMLKDSNYSIIVAGGSGITVTWPLVWSILNDPSLRDLEHSGSSPLMRRILFIWVQRHRSHLEWLEVRNLEELKAEGVDVIVPPPTAECGHPPVERITRDWLVGHELSRYQDQAKIGVVCSGPDGMNRAVTNMCSSWLREGRNVSVEIEKFGW